MRAKELTSSRSAPSLYYRPEPGLTGSVKELVPAGALSQTAGMTVSRLRVAKTETRDMAEHDRIVRSLQTSEWQMSNGTFFIAFVVIAALLTVVALILR
jgi:hypothetical protein